MRYAATQPHQKGVWHGVRHRDAGQRDLEHLGARHSVDAGPGAAALVQHIRLVGVGIGHDLRQTSAVVDRSTGFLMRILHAGAPGRVNQCMHAHLVCQKVLHCKVLRERDLRCAQSSPEAATACMCSAASCAWPPSPTHQLLSMPRRFMICDPNAGRQPVSHPCSTPQPRTVVD